ncbi:MAG: F0F1 ATP synthase subunit A [Anderseniella sp.]
MISPLEQFEILPIINLYFLVFTNSTIIILLGIFFLIFYIQFYKKTTLIPNRWNLIFEDIYNSSMELSYSNIGKLGGIFLPLIFVIFLFLLVSNLIGMVPYSFTVTSHLIITFAMALTTYIGFNIIGIKKHKFNFLNLFLPGGASLILVPLLVPIEIISYIFRVISLPVRLFANMMAGHTLLKVIAGFAWIMISLNGLLWFGHVIPLLVLVILFGLEIGVALIQAYVFTILLCIYINDALNLH